MNINRSELKENAKSALYGKGGTMALTVLVYILLSFAAANRPAGKASNLYDKSLLATGKTAVVTPKNSPPDP